MNAYFTRERALDEGHDARDVRGRRRLVSMLIVSIE